MFSAGALEVGADEMLCEADWNKRRVRRRTGWHRTLPCLGDWERARPLRLEGASRLNNYVTAIRPGQVISFFLGHFLPVRASNEVSEDFSKAANSLG
jgi:hypothetical protein